MFENLYKNLSQQKESWKTEEEVRKGWLLALESELNICFHAERGKNDASYNQVIIEFKNKGLFNGKDTSPAFQNAIYERLEKYILTKSKQEGLHQSDYIGIAIDGDHIAFAFVKDNKISHGQLVPFSEASVAMVALACKDSIRRAVTSVNLVEDFGHYSLIGKRFMQSLANILEAELCKSGNNKIKMLFSEWKTLFGQVSNLSRTQINEISRQVQFDFKIIPEKLKIPATLFVIHTYNTLIMKILAAEIISEYGLTAYRGFSERASTLGDGDLLQTLEIEIENAQIFERAGINGFVEEAIFSWYIDAAKKAKYTEPLMEALRGILIQFALYRTDNLDAAKSSDVLKAFYQDLVPESLRKSLGEFYTPDWMVCELARKTNITNWLEVRALDPTCGSGSFLIHLITLKRKEAEKKKFSADMILSNLVNSVWGFDLNPLAVQSARVNFLISIADLLSECKGISIELPVLLADAVYSPAKDPSENEDIVEYRIGSVEADLLITLPAELAFDRERLDKVFNLMAEMVEENNEFASTSQALETRKILTKDELKRFQKPLGSTYNRVLDLHKKNWNGIWFRIVRNFFWSATAGEFDLVIGNPPWVRWSNLPEQYREKIKPTCLSYSIFSDTPHHGGNELDISGMITYTVADKWLKKNGILAFVITQTHFQSPSSQGFRLFKLSEKYNLIPILVEDLKSLKPFPEAANKTALMLLRKAEVQQAQYPVDYIIWEVKEGYSKTIPQTLPLEAVLERIEKFPMHATPVGANGSPWAVLPPGHFEKLMAIVGESEWVQGRKGITADLNGIYFVQIIAENKQRGLVQIETRPEAGKTDIGPKQKFWVEPDLLYPLIKGAADFEAFRITRHHNLFVFVPNKGIVKDQYEKSKAFIEASQPSTLKYFKTFKSLLENRSTYKLRMKNAPFYSVYNVGDYTFSPYKVIWAEQSGSFSAAVATSEIVPLQGERVFVPDHKIFFVDFHQKEPAYFLCGLLNSDLVREYLHSHIISIQVGNIFKHLSLPAFDEKNPLHRKLSELSEQAHSNELDIERDNLISQIKSLAEQIITCSISEHKKQAVNA